MNLANDALTLVGSSGGTAVKVEPAEHVLSLADTRTVRPVTQTLLTMWLRRAVEMMVKTNLTWLHGMAFHNNYQKRGTAGDDKHGRRSDARMHSLL